MLGTMDKTFLYTRIEWQCLCIHQITVSVVPLLCFLLFIEEDPEYFLLQFLASGATNFPSNQAIFF